MSAEFITDVITPAELTGAVREAVSGDLPFAGFFPPVSVDDVAFELNNIPAQVGDVAHYRAWDTVPEIGKRPKVEIVTGEIPPLSQAYRLNEKDIVTFDKLKQNLADRTSQQVVDDMFNDAINAARAIQNRITLAHGELLSSGKVTLTELGNPTSGNALVATFAVPGNQNNISSGTAWSDHTNAIPITNLATWEAVFRANNDGRNPEAWVLSSTAFADVSVNAEVKSMVASSGFAPSIMSADLVAQAMKLGGVNAPLVVSDIERPALDGSGNARVIAATKVIGVSPSRLGYTPYGITAAASTLAGIGEIQWTDAPGIIAYAVRSVLPASITTAADAVAVPLLRDPAALFIGTV